MRILFLSTHVPIPVTNGQAIRTMSLMRSLAESGHALTFLSFTSASLASNALALLSSLCKEHELIQRELPTLSSHRGYLQRLLSFLRGRPYALERFADTQMKMAIRKHLQDPSLDAIVSDSIYAMVNLPETTIPVVLNCHNVEWAILDRYRRIERNPLKRAYAVIEGRRLRKAERQAAMRSHACMVCSDNDAQLLHNMLPGKEVYVIPNCVDPTAYIPRIVEPTLSSAPVILFQGGMDWYPNRDAVEYFAGHIFPLVRAEFAHARFVVAGRNPSPKFIQKLSHVEGVEFTGTVADIRPYLADAALTVVPLRIGGGTRLKILEASAAGVATVSTTVGAEGLNFLPGREIVLADEPNQFAEDIIALLKDERLRQHMAQAARRRVIDQYSFSRLKTLVEDCLTAVTSQNRLPHVLTKA